MDEGFQEVELRHPHKAKQLNKFHPMDSAVNLAEDFYMDDDSDISSQLGKKVGPTVWDHILLNRPVKVVFAMIVAVLVVPTLLYGLMYGLAPEIEPFGSCVVLQEYWSECMPGRQTNQSACSAAGCCWNATAALCHHTLPARHNYRLPPGANALTPRLQRSPLGRPQLPLKVQWGALADSHALVELSSNLTELQFVEDARIRVKELRGEAFAVSFYRQENATADPELLFHTENGPLVASKGFWEWSFQFPDDAALLGAGATSRGSLRMTSGVTTLYQGLRDRTSGRPFILCIEQSGRAHGVLLEAQGALEFVSRPTNLISVRSTAGDSSFKIHAFVGDTPAEVFDALTNYIGRPPLPPYWALGLHVCRDAGRQTPTNASVRFMLEAAELELPYDSDCVDDSALGNATFVVEEKRLTMLQEAVELLRQDERHLLLSVFSQVTASTAAFAEAEQADLLLRALRERLFLGQHRGHDVGYPDLRHPDAAAWLRTHLRAMLLRLGEAATPSGLLLPDNWPLDERPGDAPNAPHYAPQGLGGWLSNGTVWWDAFGYGDVMHQDVHNTYGATHAAMVRDIFLELLSEQNATDARVPVLSASNWHSGSVGGWLGQEHDPDWTGLKATLLSVLEAGLGGEPFSGGGAICGAGGAWSATLCTRWSLLALSTFPLARYHYRWGEPGRDPTFMDESSARIVARAARLRYELLPYLYTHMRVASETGMPVVRPMAVDFPQDNSTWSLDEQFMVGPSLMAAPVLEPESVSLTVRLPHSPKSWFHLQGGERVDGAGEALTLLAPENELILLIRGGHIMAMQDAGASSQLSRANPRHVIVALECDTSNRLDCWAQGRLWLDDGVSTDSLYDEVVFDADALSLTIAVEDGLDMCGVENFSTNVTAVSVYGVPGFVPPDAPVLVNGVQMTQSEVRFDEELSRLQMTELDVDWCEYNGTVTIQWQLVGPAGDPLTAE